jgi:hypothetical protein
MEACWKNLLAEVPVAQSSQLGKFAGRIWLGGQGRAGWALNLVAGACNLERSPKLIVEKG